MQARACEMGSHASMELAILYMPLARGQAWKLPLLVKPGKGEFGYDPLEQTKNHWA